MPQSFADFARPSYGDDRWLETQWFSLVTDAGTRIHLWAGFRTTLGVVATRVWAISRVAESLLDMDFCDIQHHIPMGNARLGDFSLWSGLSVRARPAPSFYAVTYRSPCGRLQADLEVTGLMDPVDLAWTEIEGSGPGFVGFHKGAPADLPVGRSGREPVGHIDQTMRVKGEIVLDGDRQAVDCVSQRDHSWSPRAEFHHSPGNFDQAHFGEELTLVAMTRPLPNGSVEATHAYILVDGHARKVREIEVDYHREGLRTLRFDYRILDEAGDRYEVTGHRRSSFEIDGGHNMYIAFDQFDCEWAGRSGFGETQWHHQVSKLQGLRRRGEL